MAAHESPVTDREFESMLSSFGDIALHSVSLSRVLMAQGLSLLSSRFGGLLSDADEPLDPVMERFEVELLRERFGSVALFQDGNWRVIGYRSSFLDDLLGDAGIAREDLESLRRSAQVDARIDANPWACRYRRDYLVEQRSVAMGEAIARQMELEGASIPRQDAAGLSVGRMFGETVAPIFAKHGFEPGRVQRGRDQLRYLRRPASKSCIGLEFVVDLNLFPMGRPPIGVSMSMRPSIVEKFPPSVASSSARGSFFEIVEPLVPNFGGYRSAMTPLEFSAQLHAYSCFLRAVLPVLTAVCDRKDMSLGT